MRHSPPRIEFDLVNRAALPLLSAVCRRLLPGGRCEGREYVALNPTRADRHRGSFRINLTTGRWADFATDDKGGDPVSLVAYLEGCSQGEAALKLSRLIGVNPSPGDCRHG
jgi:hypothetical protein